MKTISDYLEAYRSGREPSEVLREIWALDEDGVYITKASWPEVQAQIEALDHPDRQPLYGVPFLVKDNIDVAGLKTTAACPEFAYLPDSDSPVVARLREAGAIVLGKTNLDQFATGLVGVRTPYAPPRNAFDPDYLPGGSSCGSAIGVAKGLAAFSLGTDTAGSGRVPAAFNELIGLKPTRGYLSTRGVVDACKSLDCVSVFAHNCNDAEVVLQVAAGFDPEEAWSRKVPQHWSRFGKSFRFGVPLPDQLDYHGWDEAESLYEDAANRLEAIGGERMEIDLAPFMEAARLLYEGPWVSERYLAIRDFLSAKPEAVWPVTREIIAGGADPSAADAFDAQYKLAECRRKAEQVLASVDFVMTPTTPRNFTVEEVENDPVKLNSILGTYTNFMNLLDLSALAVPAGRYQGRLPWGVTFFAPAGKDRALLEVGAQYSGDACEFDSSWDEVQVAVCGAHLSGMPLNHQLTGRGGTLAFSGRTSPSYRMFLVPEGDGLPERPALIRVEEGGASIELEVWILTRQAFGEFVSLIPGPLGIGKVQLEDGREVPGFIAEPRASASAQDLTFHGGWRAYKEAVTGPAPA